MMSGHDSNPIFFNKKNKDWSSRAVANPPTPYVRYYLIFASSPTPRQSGRHMCITPGPITKFYNGDDIDVIAAELRRTKKYNLL